ncbi:MAG: hypothetical protein WKG07_34295 [Hymenobacter sp.]
MLGKIDLRLATTTGGARRRARPPPSGLVRREQARLAGWPRPEEAHAPARPCRYDHWPGTSAPGKAAATRATRPDAGPVAQRPATGW